MVPVGVGVRGMFTVEPLWVEEMVIWGLPTGGVALAGVGRAGLINW
jgi:hypothetical protein